MKGFFRPTKAKIVITILLLLLSSFLLTYGLSFYGMSLPNLCLPRIPEVSNQLMAVPPPEPLSIGGTIRDIVLFESGHTLCVNDDYSAQLAMTISKTLNVIVGIVIVLFLNYVIACAFVFPANISKKQKKTKVRTKS